MPGTAPAPDLVTLDEIGRRLGGLSPKKLRELGRKKGFPLRRITDRGEPVAFWSEVERWVRKHGKPAV